MLKCKYIPRRMPPTFVTSLRVPVCPSAVIACVCELVHGRSWAQEVAHHPMLDTTESLKVALRKVEAPDTVQPRREIEFAECLEAGLE